MAIPYQGSVRAFQVNEREVADFQRNGAVCLRRLIAPEQLALLREGIEQNLRRPSPRAKIASGKDDPGRCVEDFFCWQENPSYRRFIFESSIGAVAGELMHSNAVRLYHDHMLTKEPGTRQRSPWHQDQPYYNIDGQMNCSMWISVDPVDRESTLEFVAGSHKGPWLMPRSFMNNEAKRFPEGALADLPEIESARDKYPITGWDVAPGDVICFHMLTLHAPAGVAGRQRRRVFSVRFMGNDVTHAPRRWATSPDFPGPVDVLPAGAPMDHPLFPILWERPGEERFRSVSA